MAGAAFRSAVADSNADTVHGPLSPFLNDEIRRNWSRSSRSRALEPPNVEAIVDSLRDDQDLWPSQGNFRTVARYIHLFLQPSRMTVTEKFIQKWTALNIGGMMSVETASLVDPHHEEINGMPLSVVNDLLSIFPNIRSVTVQPLPLAENFIEHLRASASLKMLNQIEDFQSENLPTPNLRYKVVDFTLFQLPTILPNLTSLGVFNILPGMWDLHHQGLILPELSARITKLSLRFTGDFWDAENLTVLAMRQVGAGLRDHYGRLSTLHVTFARMWTRTVSYIDTFREGWDIIVRQTTATKFVFMLNGEFRGRIDEIETSLNDYERQVLCGIDVAQPGNQINSKILHQIDTSRKLGLETQSTDFTRGDSPSTNRALPEKQPALRSGGGGPTSLLGGSAVIWLAGEALQKRLAGRLVSTLRSIPLFW
ncbi:hypothetical protein HDU93_000134 [Gonapodya sp. JEL0774]|nr:hypothetical protein HDU93_000134 [Gonapodya sp. JEL0774]